MRTAILHIGPPKTGSTSIQRFLAGHRAELLKRGFVYPEAPGKRNHVGLAAIGTREDYRGNIMRRAGAAADPTVLRERLARDLAAEMAALPESVHSAIFSSEQLAVRIKDTAGLEQLRTLLSPHFGAFRIIGYLRRQDEAAVSRYSTGLRSGGETSAAIFPAPDDEGGV
ncbi:MAG: hypothetical protein K2X49_13375 [Acetobacteraceae bacterium]|nr:hypothetical protein [Acetobacteraceae bacterium]